MQKVFLLEKMKDIVSSDQGHDKKRYFHSRWDDDSYSGSRDRITEWKISNEIWNAEQAKKQITKQRDDDDDDDVEFIVDTTGDPDLEMTTGGMATGDEGLQEQADFVAFDSDDENNLDLNDDYYF